MKAITKEEYEGMIKNYMPFDPDILQLYEDWVSQNYGSDPDCATGGCPIR